MDQVDKERVRSSCGAFPDTMRKENGTNSGETSSGYFQFAVEPPLPYKVILAHLKQRQHIQSTLGLSPQTYCMLKYLSSVLKKKKAA